MKNTWNRDADRNSIEKTEKRIENGSTLVGDYVHKIDISLSFQEIYLEHALVALQKYNGIKGMKFLDAHFQLRIAFVSEIEIEQENDYIFFSLLFRI